MSPTAPRRHAATRVASHGIAWVLVVMVLVWYVPANVHLQWDLRAYQMAARAVAAGLDPYRLESLTAIAGHPWSLPFLYPPVTLPAFLPMALLPFSALAPVWMALELATLGALAWVWVRHFGLGRESLALVVTLLFGFNGAALIALRSGNVVGFETLLVWIGLGFWIRGRDRAFAVSIVLASLFKLAPIAFLALLLVPAPNRRPRPRLFAAGMLVFAAAIAVPLVAGPAAAWHPLGLIGSSSHVDAMDNPGALSFLDTLCRRAHLPAFVAPVAWMGYALVVVAIAVLWWRRSAPGWNTAQRALAAAVVWMLLAPRPMSYGYVMAVAPALAFAPRPFRGPAGALALAAAFSAQAWLRLANYPPGGLWQQELPFLMLLGLWLARVREDEVAARGATRIEAAPARAAA
jgi:hypothetical protein